MFTRARQSTNGALLKAIEPGNFVTIDDRPKNGGSLQARKLSTGEIRFYFRYSQLNRETQRSEKIRRAIGIWDSTAPPKMRTASPIGLSVSAALEKCAELGALQDARRSTGGLKEVDLEERRSHLTKTAARRETSHATLTSLLKTYIDYLKSENRRSWSDATLIFKAHVEESWPEIAAAPASEITPDQILDMLRRLVQAGKGRTANKLRAYLRAAYQCAIDVRTMMSIPVAFKVFAVTFNPAAQTRRDPRYDRADKRPLSADELRTYWLAIKPLEGIRGVSLRLHLLTGGQRIEQFVHLRGEHVQEDAITIFDSKGRPGQGGARPHVLPLVRAAAADLLGLGSKREFVFSTTGGAKPISATTLAAWAKERVGDAIPGFQLKRVRSGVETLLAASGFSLEIRSHLQSHGLTGVQARHYDGHDYMPEKLRALEELFAVLVSKPKANAVAQSRKHSYQDGLLRRRPKAGLT